MRALARGLADLVWPPRCPVCEDWFEPPCDDWLASGGRATMHRACLRRLSPADVLHVVADRDRTPVSSLLPDSRAWFAVLHRVKYGGEIHLLDPIVDALAAAVADGGGLAPGAVIIPVPDDPARRRARGASPVERTARQLATAIGADVRTDLVARRGSAPSQTSLADDVTRWANVRSRFRTGRLDEVAPDRPLIVVDDQATSGSTLRAVIAIARARGHPTAALVLAAARRTPARLQP